MLKKLTLVTAAAIFTMSMGIANAAPAQTGPVELSSAQMDTVNAGGWRSHRRHRPHYNRVRGNSASARADAVALGTNTRATTRTDTFSGPGVSDSSSRSNSSSSRGRTVRHYNPSCGCRKW